MQGSARRDGLLDCVSVTQRLRRSGFFLLAVRPLKPDQLHALSYHSHDFSNTDTVTHVENRLYLLCDPGGTAGKLPSSAKFDGFPWGKRNFPQIADLLRRLGESKDLARGKKVHACIKRRGYDYNSYIGNCLVQMYGACGCSAEARAAFDVIQTQNMHSFNILMQSYALNGLFKDANKVFHSMSKRNVVSWTTIIKSAVQQGLYDEALMFFHRMDCEGLSPNIVTIINILEACSILEDSYEIHCLLIVRGFEADIRVATSLITVYGRCGSFKNARYIFKSMPNKNMVTWGALMTALTKNGRPKEAVEAFIQMNSHFLSPDKPDKASYLCALHACANLGALKTGCVVHAMMIKEGFEVDTVVGNILVTFYGRAGNLDGAMIIFRKVIKRDAVTWSAIISACAQNGDSKEALKLFNQMKLGGFQPLITTNVSTLDACSDLMAVKEGREVHIAITKNGSEAGTVVGNSLVKFYGRCGNIPDAKCALAQIQHQDVISWNSIISACLQRGHFIESIENFHQMLDNGIEPDSVTFTFVREACYRNQGIRHKETTVSNDACEPHARVPTPHLYGRWNNVVNTRIEERSAIEHSVMAIKVMRPCPKIVHKTEMIDQLHLSQLNVSSTAYNKLEYVINKALNYALIKSCKGEKFLIEHYIEIIDSLNHAGHLREAEDLLQSVPYAAIVIPWLSLLCSCRLHGDICRGQRAANECLELDPGNVSPYFELICLCALASWEDKQ